MAKFIYQVSKFNVSKQQLRLKERYNSARDCVTATATLHLGVNTFLSGMFYAFQDNEGDISFSFNKSEDVQAKVDTDINFKPEQLTDLLAQLTELGTTISKPPTNDDGVSELRGFQLHVVLNDDELSYYQTTDSKYGDKLVYKIQAHQVKSVKLVTASDEAYIEAPGARKIDINLAMKALYKPTQKCEEFIKVTTVEEAKAQLLDFSKAKSRGASRKAKKQEVVQSNVAATLMSTSTSTSIILVDNEDDDDDMPE